MNKTLVAVAILGTAVSGSAMAQTKQPKPFTLEGGLGFIFTSGNTDTTSANASLEAHQELTDWSNDYSISGLYKQEEVENDDGEKEDRTSAQRFDAQAQANYKLENPDYRLFGFASYEDDRFSSYNYQSTIAAGWNQKLWNDDTTSFEYSIGPGYAFNEFNDGQSQNSFIVRASGAFQWLISDTAKFTQTLSTEVGSDNTKSSAESALTASISGNLSLKVSVAFDHNTNVADGLEKLDTETALTLVYNFI